MKGNSSCTTMIAVEALKPSRPVKVMEYWMVALTNAIQNIRCMKPTGGLTNQMSARVVRAKRQAIIKIGGKSLKTKATLANVKPNPQITGTEMAKRMSIGLKRSLSNGMLVLVLLV